MDDLRDEALRRTRAETLAHELRTAIEAARDKSAEDPFGNPILLVALSLTRRLDRGEIGEDDLAALVQHLGWEAVRDRARRLRRYVGLDGAVPEALMTLAERLAEPTRMRPTSSGSGTRSSAPASRRSSPRIRPSA